MDTRQVLRCCAQVQTLKDLDLNGDAEIDFKEFMTMCRE